MATRRAASAIGACTRNIARQPMASTRGPPATSPSTGAPAPTSDHQPIALTRSSSGNARMINAIDAGPVAAPGTAPMARIAISDAPSQANAVRIVATVNPARPTRYTRRWPRTSPILPNSGIDSARARKGPVTVHVSAVSLAPRSRATSPSETARIVIVNPVANRPASAAQSTHHRYRSLSRTRRPRRSRSNIGHATAGTSSPPGYSTTSGDSGSRSIGSLEASFRPRQADGPPPRGLLSTASSTPTRSRVFEHPDGLEVRLVLVFVGLCEQPCRRLGPAGEIGGEQQAPYRPVGAGSQWQLAVSPARSPRLR